MFKPRHSGLVTINGRRGTGTGGEILPGNETRHGRITRGQERSREQFGGLKKGTVGGAKRTRETCERDTAVWGHAWDFILKAR